MKKGRNNLWLLALLLLTAPPTWAQKEFTTWCFGAGGANGALPVKVRFNESGPLPADTCRWVYPNAETSYAGFGNATVSDAGGNLVLYTNGFVVMNRRHRLMAGGILTTAGLPIDRSRDRLVQPAAVTPGPDGRYYVFYWSIVPGNNTVAESLTYAVVDARQQGGDGAVIRQGITLTSTNKEASINKGLDLGYSISDNQSFNHIFLILLFVDSA